MDPTCEFPLRKVKPLDFDLSDIIHAAAPAAETGEARATHPSATQALAVASGLRDLCGEACIVAGNLRALVYLFEKALGDDGKDTPLTAASYVVLDCMRTMADRLDGIETAAAVRYAPLAEARRG